MLHKWNMGIDQIKICFYVMLTALNFRACSWKSIINCWHPSQNCRMVWVGWDQVRELQPVLHTVVSGGHCSPLKNRTGLTTKANFSSKRTASRALKLHLRGLCSVRFSLLFIQQRCFICCVGSSACLTPDSLCVTPDNWHLNFCHVSNGKCWIF